MIYRALQYVSYVEVLKPKNLSMRIKKSICEMHKV